MLQLHEKNILLTEQMKTMEGKLHMAKRVRGPDQIMFSTAKLIFSLNEQLLKEQDVLIRQGQQVCRVSACH